MTVIPFPQLSHVQIDGGVVTLATITGEHGTRPNYTSVGKYRFFVDVVEPDGGRLSIWDGPSHADAVREASELSRDFGPVRDRTNGGDQ